MANISFGQNILPKTDNTYSLGNSSYKWHAYLADINGQAIEDLVLPAVTSSDNDKILKVSSGEWTVGDAPSGLPTVSSTDNGKILSVSSGEWTAITSPYLTSHQDISGKANTADLATVATSGLYSDLTGTPDISGFYTKPSGGIPASDLADTYLTAATEKWSGYTINLNTTTGSDSLSVLIKSNNNIYYKGASNAPAYGQIAMYDNNACLNSTTPSSDDNSTKVATTAFVQTAISGLGSGGGSGLPSVSSTDNGKILQVSSGAWSIVTPNFLTSHQDISGLAPKADPVFTGSISLGRYSNSTVGTRSVAIGYAATASGDYTLALGYDAQATKSHSHAMGFRLKASSDYSTVLGLFNLENQMPADVSRWASNTDYTEGDHATIPTVSQDNTIIYPKYRCITTHNSGDSIVKDNWILEPNFCFIIGNGADEANRGNAVAIDWDGNGYYKGDIYVGANFKTNFGSKVATEAYVTSALANFSGGITGVTLVSTTLTPDSNGVVTIPAMTGATSSAAGATGLVPAPTSADVDKFLAGDGTYKSGGLPMVILSYGSSTWAQFEAAYNNNVIVYARASSNANPATGSQTRMAFMAYVNNATTPTEVEFQYYRSMSSHSATAMGDQVFVYKLTKTGGWSVTTRDASIKQIKVDTNDPGTVSWSSNVVTLKSGLPKVTASDNGKILKVVNGAWAAVSPE